MVAGLNLKLFLLIASAVCFAVALLGAVGAVSGVSQAAWDDGGFLALVLGLLA